MKCQMLKNNINSFINTTYSLLIEEFIIFNIAILRDLSSHTFIDTRSLKTYYLYNRKKIQFS